MSAPMTPERARELLGRATPGPWKVCEMTIHGRKYGGCWVEGPDIDDGDGRLHGLLIPISGSGGSMSYTTRLVDMQDHDHNDANAHLIAAAPALARAYLAEHEARVAAEAAQALVLEQAAEVMDQKWFIEDSMRDAIKAEIRDLAPASGVEALAALREERDEAKRLMQARHREMLAADDLMRKHQRRAEAAEAKRDTLAAQVEALRAVKVKPLVWEGHNGFWRARTPLGDTYEILEAAERFHWSRISSGFGTSLTPCDTLEAAKAAAQADYEARIRAALKDQP